MLEEMANILLAERDLTKAPKKIDVNWVISFINRYPDLKIKFSSRLTYSRALCEDPVIIGGFFTNLTQLKLEHGIADEDIYNFDETGFAMGIAATAKVIYSADRTGKLSLIQLGNRE